MTPIQIESYQKLMGEDKAQMIFTDPPYNVPVQGHVCGNGKVKHEEFAMASGEMSQSQFTQFLQQNFKPGTRLVRTYQGKQHDILVTKNAFAYKEKTYNSLSSIAHDITGKRWNGWIFFGLKKATTS